MIPEHVRLAPDQIETIRQDRLKIVREVVSLTAERAEATARTIRLTAAAWKDRAPVTVREAQIRAEALEGFAQALRRDLTEGKF